MHLYIGIQAGTIDNYWTPSVARLGCYVTAQLSPYQGEKIFKEFGQMQPSKSALSRLSTQLGETLESEQPQLERLFCADITLLENAVTVSASLDGIMIPLNKEAARVIRRLNEWTIHRHKGRATIGKRQ